MLVAHHVQLGLLVEGERVRALGALDGLPLVGGGLE